MNCQLNIARILDLIRANPCCRVYPSTGMPYLAGTHTLPDELKEFYTLCGGIEIYYEKPYGYQILQPQSFLLANPILIGELYESDISSEWYTLAKDISGNYITIDLNPLRMGRCYDSFWDRHGVVGECAIVAMNFSELLLSLYKNKGESVFWLNKAFTYLGDAYDS